MAVLIENPQGEWLLCRRGRDPGKGLLDLPGGFVEFHESAEEAAAREVKEELNLHIKDLFYLGSVPGSYAYRGWVYQILNLVFRADVDDFSPLRAHSDVAGWVFIRPMDIDPRDIGLESIQKIVKQYRNMGNNNRFKGDGI